MFDILSTISVKFTEEEVKESLTIISGSNDVVITSIEVGNGSETKGDAYLSTIYRFTVKARGKANEKEETICLHVIAKGIPKNVARRKTFRSLDFFETEVHFYNNVWPLMKKLKDSKDLNEPDEVPLLLSAFSNGKDDYVTLKDLSFDGYGTVQRNLGISQEYASLFLKLLANFHALSIAARHLNPEFEETARSLKFELSCLVLVLSCGTKNTKIQKTQDKKDGNFTFLITATFVILNVAFVTFHFSKKLYWGLISSIALAMATNISFYFKKVIL